MRVNLYKLETQIRHGLTALPADQIVVDRHAARGQYQGAPGGAFYLFINCAGLIGRTTDHGHPLASDLDVALYFMDDAGVAVIGGTSFGLAPYFRISIATKVEVIEEAFRRIAASVAKLAA